MIKNIFRPVTDMSYPAGHNDAVRRRILHEARKAFNRHGYDGVTIDAVMKAAGLTRGAFYFHFRSKAQLYRDAIAFVLQDHPVERWRSPGSTLLPAQQLIDAYLSERHLQAVEESCPLITHSAAAARHDPKARTVFASVLQALVHTLSRDITSDDGDDAALVIAAMCVGGLSLARGVDDPLLARRLLKATRKAALDLGGWKTARIQRSKRSASQERSGDPELHRHAAA